MDFLCWSCSQCLDEAQAAVNSSAVQITDSDTLLEDKNSQTLEVI